MFSKNWFKVRSRRGVAAGRLSPLLFFSLILNVCRGRGGGWFGNQIWPDEAKLQLKVYVFWRSKISKWKQVSCVCEVGTVGKISDYQPEGPGFNPRPSRALNFGWPTFATPSVLYSHVFAQSKRDIKLTSWTYQSLRLQCCLILVMIFPVTLYLINFQNFKENHADYGNKIFFFACTSTVSASSTINDVTHAFLSHWQTFKSILEV